VMEPRTAGESVERVAGLLVTAQERAGLATWDLDQPRAFLRESAVELAAWQALDLLPLGTQVSPVAVAGAGVVAVLVEAEAELQRFAIGEYPRGTSALVARVGDLLSEYRCPA